MQRTSNRIRYKQLKQQTEREEKEKKEKERREEEDQEKKEKEKEAVKDEDENEKGRKRTKGGRGTGKGKQPPTKRSRKGKEKEHENEEENGGEVDEDEKVDGAKKGKGRGNGKVTRVAKRTRKGTGKGKSKGKGKGKGGDEEEASNAGDEGEREEKETEKEIVEGKGKKNLDWRKVGFVGRGTACYEGGGEGGEGGGSGGGGGGGGDCMVGLLPEETLLRVFQFLDLVSLSRASMVCTVWFNLCFDKSMRRILDFSEQDEDVCARTRSSHIKRIVVHCPHLTVVNLRGVAQVTDATIKVIFTYCKELLYLNCWSATELTDRSLFYINNMTTLQGLDIASCSKMSNEAISSSIKNLTNLQSLNLSGHPGYSLRVPASILPGMKHLELEGTEVMGRAIPEHGRNLSLLNLRLCSVGYDTHTIGPLRLSFAAAIFLLPNLKCLYAEHANWISNGSVEEIKTVLKGRSSTTTTTSDDTQDFNALTAAPRSTTPWGFSTTTTTSSSSSNQVGTSAQPVDLAALGLADRRTLPMTLLYLDRVNISSPAFSTLLQLCEGLQYLSLQYCDSVDDALLASLAHNCPRIEELFLTGCRTITSAGIKSLREEATKLIVLAVGDLPPPAAQQINDYGFYRHNYPAWEVQRTSAFREEVLKMVEAKQHFTLTYCETSLQALSAIQKLKPDVGTDDTPEHIMREVRNTRRKTTGQVPRYRRRFYYTFHRRTLLRELKPEDITPSTNFTVRW